jgi:hypothetical protein
LSYQQKKDLVGRNIITCADLIKRPDILKDIGIRSEADMGKILHEAKIIIGEVK